MLALPPINAWPVLFFTFPVLVWLVDGSAAGRWSGAWRTAGAGWCFGFGYFLAGLYWIGYAFLVDAKTFGWLLPIAVAGLPAFLALYPALGLAAARLIWVRGPERVLALAAALTSAKWLRGHLVTGFPWRMPMVVSGWLARGLVSHRSCGICVVATPTLPRHSTWRWMVNLLAVASCL